MGQPEGRGAAPVNLLLVDDDAGNRNALRSILEAPDRRLVEASSADEALRRLLDQDFAVLLVDVVMPGMNGFELATAVKARERTAAVPIIFLTGQANEGADLHQGYLVGAVDYLVKPLRPEMVRAKVAVFVELYRQRQRIEQQAAQLVEVQRLDAHLQLAELQLASERRYRALADAIPDIVWTARADGEVDYFNRRWFEYTGLSGEESGGSWRGAVHPEDVPRCDSAWREALASGQMLQLECRLRHLEGEHRWHLCRAVPERGASGPIVAWLGTFTDIEDQKRSEAVLAEFKGTLDAVLDAVFIFDADASSFLYVNQGASALLGYSRDELSRMRPLDVLVEHDEEAFRELLAPLRDGSKVVITLETQVRRRNAWTVPVELSLQFIQIDGGRMVSIARDITDRRNAQLERELLYREAVDAIRARDEFLSVASHELRTPISVLHLQIEMLQRSLDADPGAALPPEKARTKLELVARQTDRLSRLVGQLMDVSRIRAGRLRLELEEVDLAAIVRDVAARHGEEAARAGTQIRVGGVEVARGRWDRLRLEQVVTNLITNAMKFGLGQPVEISVDDHGPCAGLAVTDHGVGITAEDIERIFERYEQGTSARGRGGLGLGLYIVRQIVEAHGGTVRVESQAGAGSTFKVELPREPPAAKPEPDPVAPDGGDEASPAR
jgi:PAS domain S-box-containing protein